MDDSVLKCTGTVSTQISPIAFMSRFFTGIPTVKYINVVFYKLPIDLWSGRMVEIKCPFMSRFLGDRDFLYILLYCKDVQ